MIALLTACVAGGCAPGLGGRGLFALFALLKLFCTLFPGLRYTGTFTMALLAGAFRFAEFGAGGVATLLGGRITRLLCAPF